MFEDLSSFISKLESEHELVRIDKLVDPNLEITEIATRSILENKPALFFENVKGSPYPILINSLGSDRRIELALGKHPSEIGEGLLKLLEDLNPPNLKSIWNNRFGILKLLNTRPKLVRDSKSLFYDEKPDLEILPALKCWPDDGGKFITLPMVFTKDPISNKENVGMYRMQIFDKLTTGMHMQLQKGGGFHYHNAEKMNIPLDVAVAIGTDPATLLASITPLPEGISEIMFAGFLKGKRPKLQRGKSININYPTNAEFILEGILRPKRRRQEGPFGDHFGHYSLQSPHPIFEVRKIVRKKNPIYSATVVGKPPQEDKYMGDAVQMITKPLIKLLKKEIVDMWSYYESGFHNLLVVSVDQRYSLEALKTAYGILGEGQLSLTKTLVLVNGNVDPSDKSSVINEIRKNFVPKIDFHLLSKTFIDTLDFTGEALHKGSKMVINATSFGEETNKPIAVALPANINTIVDGLIETRLVGKTLLVAKTSHNGKKVLKSLINHPLLKSIKIIATVSSDIDINNDTDLLWGIFTRFDPSLDVDFSELKFNGINTVFDGVMGIDATWKDGYPKPLEMNEEIIRKVDNNWDLYWK
tara:strand:- start:7876 stop:9633 length:1758 start_codon:yes stop_codon:yes gene_type:complete